MLRLTAMLVRLDQHLDQLLDHQAQRHTSDRGSVTIEHVAWAVAVLLFVGIVVTAIKAYVTAQAGNIK